MNTRLLQKQFTAIAIAFLLIFFSGQVLAANCSDFTYADSTWTVNGTNNHDTDWDNINTVLNVCANPGDTILLKGNFQIGKFVAGVPVQPQIHVTKSNLIITGDKTNDQWNTVIKGITNPNGTIPTVNTSAAMGLLGFLYIGPTDGVISNITIKDLKIVDMSRAISVTPSIDVTTGYCSDTHITNGNSDNIVVRDNWFEHTARAVQVLGSTQNMTVSNNIIHNNEREAIYFQGFGTSCSITTTASTFFFMSGSPEHIKITDNLIYNDAIISPSTGNVGTGSMGVRIYFSNDVTIANNTFQKGARNYAIFLSGTSDSTVSKNVMTGVPGVRLFGIVNADLVARNLSLTPPQPWPVTNNLKITNNSVQDIGLATNSSSLGFGIYVDSETSDTKISNNQFNNNQHGDIRLAGTTSAFFANTLTFLPSSFNTVITTNFGTIVVDNGVNNKLLGTMNLVNNPNVPDAVQDQHIDDELGRPGP